MRFDQIMHQSKNKMTNTRQMPMWGGGAGGGGEYARLELTEPLINKVILPGKLSILCDV